MASAQLTLQSVEFAHPGMTAPLFTDLTVQFPSGWTGIVGPNGAGKTTLLKVATGELAPQSGVVHRQGLALYVAQRTDDPPEFFEDFVWAADAGVLKARLRIGEDWPERWATLSHGERKRAQIAVALWREPVVLALDEPSNHIDSDARRLLWQALRDFGGVGLLVSHDRTLLDELCPQCLLLDPPEAVMRPGGVTEALKQQELDEKSAHSASEALRRSANRLQAEAQRRRVIADQKAAAARGSKQKKIPAHDHDGRAMRNLAKLTGKDAYAGRMVAQMSQRASKVAAQRAEIAVKKRYETGIWVEGASFMPRDFLLRLPAGHLPLGGGRALHYPDLAIGGTSRIALKGANGLGKSTLVRHLLGQLQLPAEKVVTVPQEISAEESRALLEAVKRLPNDERGRVMTTISRLGSRPARLLESALPSPGEVRKLLLAIGIVRGPHLIVMDEPTNHMDLPGIVCLEEALADCPCAMLLVSHDESFLAKITDTDWLLVRDTAGDSRLEIRAVT
ncbi:ATP-binding cassette domain-containing protein [Opitutus terrae]|uniref:ABC transporter related n=1 Tax=Opitutus terrae (strain DSM 11246 / JCM 15787 / PB90-1) TaxID=452637 RepID=B1ZXU3_OPITP|nr:ATP-binding cassette domain-containing protein [Opitutus terrae]ACB74311.1 ABC transporter related [Opitutus terrae PB90-1]